MGKNDDLTVDDAGDVVLPPVPASPNDWNPQEALFAFCGWLTTRKAPTVLSATDDASVVVERIKEFAARHDLQTPRAGWDKLIRSTKTEPAE